MLHMSSELNGFLGGEETLEDNIRIDLRAILWQGVDWIHLAQYREQRLGLVKTVMKFLVS